MRWPTSTVALTTRGTDRGSGHSKKAPLVFQLSRLVATLPSKTSAPALTSWFTTIFRSSIHCVVFAPPVRRDGCLLQGRQSPGWHCHGLYPSQRTVCPGRPYGRSEYHAMD